MNTPKSCANRGNPDAWAKKWIRYHKAILQMNMPVFSVPLTELLNDKETTLRTICKYIEVEFHENMLNYLNHTHHIVFGSVTARAKLHKAGSEAYYWEMSQSNRADFQGDIPAIAAKPTHNETSDIAILEEHLSEHCITANAGTNGKFDLNLILAKKSLERLVFKIGLEPRTVSRILRKL